MFFALVTLLRIASRIACLIVIVSFGLFVIDQTGSASAHQQEVVSGTNGGPASKQAAPPAKEDEAHKVIDEVADKLTSPFSGLTAGSTSQWAIRGVSTVMALLVYGVGIGFLARFLRLRV
jgi:hypothetical protein